MSASVRILGISGSLRRNSYNTAALRAAQELAPSDMRIEMADLSAIPLYNQDEQDRQVPESVARLVAQVQAADAILFATPEYNYSVPGVLKNAIDWVSRAKPQPFAGKPAAVMGASPGALGTGRAQYHLRQIGVFLDLHFLNKPEILIASAHERFDAQGKLTHEPTREYLGKLLLALKVWTHFHQRGTSA